MDLGSQLKISNDDFVFLTVGAPVAMKGHREIAEAFALLDTGGRAATLILNANWVLNANGPNTGLLGRIVSPFKKAFHRLRSDGWQGLMSAIRRRIRRMVLERKSAGRNGFSSEMRLLRPIDESIKSAE